MFTIDHSLLQKYYQTSTEDQEEVLQSHPAEGI